MSHSKLRGLRVIAAALGLGLTLACALPAQALAAVHSGKKKPVAAQKAAAAKGQRKAHATASRPLQAHTVVRAKNGKKAALHTAHATLSERAAPKGRRLSAKAAAVAGAGALAAGGAHALAHDDGPLRLSANAALVIDQNSREVLFSKNDRAVLPIASLTKLMTGLLVADAKLPLDEEITITEEDLDTYKGTGSRLSIGTRLTRGELLHIALMSSENRAANALGRTYPGGLSNFVRLMNQKAASSACATPATSSPLACRSRTVPARATWRCWWPQPISVHCCASCRLRPATRSNRAGACCNTATATA